MGTGPVEARFRQALTLRKKSNSTKAVYNQEQSPLFKLPPEIRVQIWELTLSPHKSAKHAHFHIYDEIYDSCLYCTQFKAERYRRKHPTQMSLLLTCRAAYAEGKLFLWKNSKFTIVLCAGKPRPQDELYGRNCLGPIVKCRDLFGRMRHVTLVVQPGKRPDAKKYVARVTQLLEAMNYLEHIETLYLHLNFHSKLTRLNGGPKRFKTILKSFQTIDRHGRHFSMEISTNAEGSGHYQDLFRTIAGPQRTGNAVATHLARGSTTCVKRAQRDGYANPSMPPGDLGWAETAAMVVFSAIMMGGYVAFLPISVSLTYAYHVRRKINKGDDHAWCPWRSMRRGN